MLSALLGLLGAGAATFIEGWEDMISVGVTPGAKTLQLNLRMANRHGLISGATGTGKTVTLQTIAEQFSRAGIPVFTADVKGDLSGLSQPGERTPKLEERLKLLGQSEFSPRAVPVLFWDIYGEKGHPVRTTVSEMGPLLMARLLKLNDTQQGVLELAFKLADDQGLLLLDLKDLRELLVWIGEHSTEVKIEYGNISPATIGTIQRALLSLSERGGKKFFGEPALKLEHLMQRDFSGQGVVSILDATQLINDTRIYSTFLLWLLSELFENLDEVGDAEKPRMVFFFDEAHLLFNNAPDSLLEKIEQVVRLIRSKGVGIYFVTQNPLDIPETVLGQLGNRIQHALRAFTPKDQKAVRAAAQTFRGNPEVDVEVVIGELGVGEALVSLLDEKGTPTPVERALIRPPDSRIGVVSDEQVSSCIARSPLAGVYEEQVDRESAFEMLNRRAQEFAAQVPSKPSSSGRQRQSSGEAFFKSMVRSIGSQIGRGVYRGMLGSIFRGR